MNPEISSQLSKVKNLPLVTRMKLHKICSDFQRSTYHLPANSNLTYDCFQLISAILRENLWLDVSQIFETQDEELLAEVQERISKCDQRGLWRQISLLKSEVTHRI